MCGDAYGVSVRNGRTYPLLLLLLTVWRAVRSRVFVQLSGDVRVCAVSGIVQLSGNVRVRVKNAADSW
jgi:hypothetical protein